MNQYDCIIFDLDGTLLNTLEDLTDAINHIMKQYNLEQKTVSQVRSYLGNGVRKLVERCVPEGQHHPQFQQIYDDYRVYYTAHCQVKTAPYKGVMELLAGLKEQGYKLAIVSNKNDKAVEKLNKLFFEQYITVAKGINDSLRPKPAPDTVYQALEELGCTSERALYIGDSEVDRATAENALMDCVSVTWGFRDRDLLESLKPKAIIDKPEELYAVLEA